MKRNIKFAWLTMIFILIFVFQPISLKASPVSTDNTKEYISPSHSREELYRDIFILLLSPKIESAVEKYYGKSYGILLSAVKILSIERPLGYRANIYIIKLRVAPYEGPHNAVGLDDITLNVSGSQVKVVNYKHIKSFPLPNY